MTLGSLIAAQRKRLRFSQEELAKMAGVSREQVSKLENNRAQHPSWGDLKNIAQALSLPPNDVLAAAGYPVEASPLPPAKSMVNILRQALAIAEELERTNFASTRDRREDAASGRRQHLTPVGAARS